jgi:hypothetical protein
MSFQIDQISDPGLHACCLATTAGYCLPVARRAAAAAAAAAAARARARYDTRYHMQETRA